MVVYLTLIPAVIMVISDFRHREIAIWSLFLFAIFSFGSALYSFGWATVIANVAYNVLLMLYFGVGIMVYLWIRNRQFTNPLKHYLGLGDLLFVLAFTPLFGLKEFLVFMLASMISGLVWWWLFGRQKTVPLVSIMGIVLGIYLIIDIV